MIRVRFHLVLLFNFSLLSTAPLLRILANKSVGFSVHFAFQKDGPNVIAGDVNLRRGYISL